MKNKRFTAIVLAAGKGTRMKSPLPKVLHPVAGRPMILRLIESLKEAGASEIRIVVGHGENLVRQVVEPTGAICFLQTEQKGTADAVKCAQPDDIEGPVIIINGDHPLIEGSDISHMLESFSNGEDDIMLVSSKVRKPGKMGRVVRNGGQVKAIVEAKDASSDTLKINEINVGIYLLRGADLKGLLPLVDNQNAQGEFYLTDIISLCIESGGVVGSYLAPAHVAHGVNSQSDLAKATSYAFKRKAKRLMESGVVMLDPKSTYVEEGVKIGEATVVYPNVFIRGKCDIGRFCVIEPNCVITDSVVQDSVKVLAGTYLDEVSLANHSSVGPYARLRPGTFIGEDAKVGNFVEMKKTKFGPGAKAGHLTYLGDAEIGKDTNIGCGTITCNYAVDKKKYKTIIGDNVFVGSDTQFVAPLEVGDDSVIASGSTITKNVPKGSLAVARGRQIIKENYKPKSDK